MKSWTIFDKRSVKYLRFRSGAKSDNIYGANWQPFQQKIHVKDEEAHSKLWRTTFHKFCHWEKIKSLEQSHRDWYSYNSIFNFEKSPWLMIILKPILTQTCNSLDKMPKFWYMYPLTLGNMITKSYSENLFDNYKNSIGY